MTKKTKIPPFMMDATTKMWYSTINTIHELSCIDWYHDLWGVSELSHCEQLLSIWLEG